MNRSTIVFLCVVAAAAAGTSIAVGSNLSVAVPAGAIAVGAGAVLLVGIAEQTRWPSARSSPARDAAPAKLRSSFRAGPLGRADLIDLLDTLERASGGPPPRSLSPEERGRLQVLRPEEFRDYISGRISDLEQRT